MTISIGIPSKGINKSTLRVIGQALNISGVSEVLVSVNPGEMIEVLSNEIVMDPKVKVTFHEKDLGLYGNFRYLAKSASSEKFMWLCTDDSPSFELLELSESMDINGAMLAIPTWSWAEYRPETCSFEDKSISGLIPPEIDDEAYPHATTYPEPSWIFGLWDAAFLRQIMPFVDFDWLDVHILQQALLSGKVIYVNTTSPMIIGTWNWANKKPNSLKSTGPHSRGAIFYQLLSLPKFASLGFIAFFSACKRVRTLIHLSRHFRMVRRLSSDT